MGRSVGSLLLLMAIGLGVPAFAGQAAISGKVKNADGVPQMGAMVEAVSYNNQKSYTAFTDSLGSYSFSPMAPGTYDVRVSAASFLPTLRENVSLKSGATLVINLTLNTLSDAIRMLPARQGSQEDDDWKWTLRSAANRPILRIQNGQPVVVANTNDRPMKAAVAFMAGDSDTLGASELSTRFHVERSLFQTGILSFKGDLGYGPGANGSVFRATYSHQLDDGSRPEVSLTVRRFATSPTLALHDAALEAMTFSVGDNLNLGDFMHVRVGSEFQSVQFLGRVNTFKPYGSVDAHLGPNTVLEYQYATSVPNMRHWKGFDSAPADLTESAPRVTLTDSQSVLERGHHQEISLSRRLGRTSVQGAYYQDRVRNAALAGVGDFESMSGDVLPDMYSATFAYNGGDLETNGLRVVVQRQLSNGLTATVNYAFGGVLDLDKGVTSLADARASFSTERRHALSAKLAGTLPHSKTEWLTSYRWTSAGALTPVDWYNSGPGQTDAYLNVFIRQPLPGTGFMPGKMEALVDLRNLLAQGYRPMVGPDGQTVYLVQAARSVRGGVAFVF